MPLKPLGPPVTGVPLHQDGIHHNVEAQGRHGQVVSAQLECGKPHRQRDEGRRQGHGDHHGPGRSAQRGGADGRPVSPDGEKGGVAQADLAGNNR